MSRVYCTACKRPHLVEVNDFGALCTDGKVQLCDQSNWYELDGAGIRPWQSLAQRDKLEAVMQEATQAGLTPDYAPDDEAMVGDLLALEKQQQALAIVLVHNLPGTPLLSFSVYGVGRAYAAALELVEKFQDADNRTGPEKV